MRTILRFIVRVGHGRIKVEVIPHLVPLLDDFGCVTSGYEVGDFPLGCLPRKRTPEVPVEGHT